MLRIRNKGEIDINALILLGASTKRGKKDQIGFFGSGAKYALAVFLRSNMKMEIYSGLQEIIVGVENVIMRDETFKAITINGVKTGMTLDSGPQWRMWQAFREIYCNAIDEGLTSFELLTQNDIEEEAMNHTLEGVKGETTFMIWLNDELRSVLLEFANYFIADRKPLLEHMQGQILAKNSPGHLKIFRKGILCYTYPQDSMYDYNLEKAELNEARELRFASTAESYIQILAASCEVPEIINRFIAASGAHTYYEGRAFHEPIPYELSAAWKTEAEKHTLATRQMVPHIPIEQHNLLTIVSEHLMDKLNKQFQVESVLRKSKMVGNYTMVEISSGHKMLLEDAIDRLKFADIELTEPVFVAILKQPGLMATAMPGVGIILSTEAFANGLDYLMQTLIEEHIHFKYEVLDNTRQMQDKLLSYATAAIQKLYYRKDFTDPIQVIEPKDKPDGDDIPF